MKPRLVRPLRPGLDRLEDRRLLSSGITPVELKTAYGLNNVLLSLPGGSVVGNGAGQTIALVEAYNDPYLAHDLVAFDQTYNIPNPNFQVVNLGGNVANPGWALEETLDVEWAHALAPYASILVIEAKSQTRQALLNAVNVARQAPGVSVVSMSWGFSEVRNEAAFNTYFRTPANHQGVTFFAASGDNGTQGGVQWPSSAPDVVSVGGTSLRLNAFGGIASETTWVNSGGGYSKRQAEPSFQYGVQASGRRSTPDVAFDGDPNTGVQVYETALATGQGSWQVVGGTSLGTPAWAAIIAIVDQGRALQGYGSLDGSTQTLPALYALPSSDFNPIPPLTYHTVGSATTSALTSTGRGSPHGPTLITDLVSFTTTGTVGSPASLVQAQAAGRARPAAARGGHDRAIPIAFLDHGQTRAHPAGPARFQQAKHPRSTKTSREPHP